jgi:hypothetical protein
MCLNCSLFFGVTMPKNEGTCTSEPTRTIDDAIDEAELLPY